MEVSKNQRMIFLAFKTQAGRIKGNIAFYCGCSGSAGKASVNISLTKTAFGVPESGGCYERNVSEDECNDTCGRIRMYQALLLKQPEGIQIPSERTVYRVMDQIGLSHRPKRKPNGVTKADREAMKSDNLLKWEFHSDAPLEKCVIDITEIKASDGKLYVSAIFDCFDLGVLGLAMETNMKSDCISIYWKTIAALEGAEALELAA